MKINDIDVEKEFNIFMAFSNPDTLLPTISTHMQTLGEYGAVNYGTTFSTKTFSVDCLIVGKNYIDKLNLFKNIFFDEKGKASEVKLELNTLHDKYYTVILTKQIEAKPVGINSATFTLELIAYDPFSYAIKETSFYTEAIKDNLYEIPISYKGDFPTGIEVSMFGMVSTFDIEVHDKDEAMTNFHYEVAEHETFITLDFINFTIDDNGTNGLPNASGHFPEICSTTEKIVIKGGLKASCTVKFRERYL